jgi:hypothetical protein
MNKSWRTTTIGWLTLAGTLISGAVALLDGDPSTNPNVESIFVALTGVGLLVARDNKVSSENAGAK